MLCHQITKEQDKSVLASVNSHVLFSYSGSETKENKMLRLSFYLIILVVSVFRLFFFLLFFF